MFFGPNGLDTEGIGGRGSGSCLVRPVAGRGPLWGGMARTDGARERWRSPILGGARLRVEGPAAQRWVRSVRRSRSIEVKRKASRSRDPWSLAVLQVSRVFQAGRFAWVR